MQVEQGLHYDSRFGGIVTCQTCSSRVGVRQGLAQIKHFRGPPHLLKGARLQHISRRLAELELADDERIEYPACTADTIAPVQGLPVLDGWECRHCEDWLSVNVRNSRAHLSSIHRMQLNQEPDALRRCSLQTLSRKRNLIRYFKVDPLLRTSISSVFTASATVFVGKEGDEEHARRLRRQGRQNVDFDQKVQETLAQIREKEKEAAAVVGHFDVHKSAVITWISHCCFEKHLHGRNRAAVLQLSRRSSGQKGEKGLACRIADAVERILEQTWSLCINGDERRMTRPMAVRLSQFGLQSVLNATSTPGRLFGFRVAIEESTRKRYFKLWAHFMLYYGRVTTSALRNEPDEGLAGGEGPLFYGTEGQDCAFQHCVTAARECESEERNRDGNDARTTKTLKMAVSRFAQHVIQQDLIGNQFESPLLSYCASLALSERSGGWKLPGNFNSSLSGLVYCAQLWIFHEALKQADEDNGAKIDHVLDRLCRQWLSHSRSTTFGLILNWRLLLFTVARREVSSQQATWTLDGNEISYAGTAITMTQITQLYHCTLDRARRLLDDDLLLGASHLPRMTAALLQDGEHRVEHGWWFGLDERNTDVLRAREERLLEHIKHNDALRAVYLHKTRIGTGCRWRRSALDMYEGVIQEFLGCLWVLFQLLPPLRGPEGMAVRIRNAGGRRNVFLKHGRVMVHTTYHKTQAQSGAHRDNVRFLPLGLGELLLDYMVYVEPLRQIMAWERGQKQAQSPYLWTTKSGEVWSPQSLTPILRRACAAAKVPKLSESSWRQICASIVKIKFGDEERRCLIQLADNSGSACDDDDGLGDMDADTMATMFNHTTRTHNLAYANEVNLAGANVWDGLIKQSYRACMLWTQFFGFDDETRNDQSVDIIDEQVTDNYNNKVTDNNIKVTDNNNPSGTLKRVFSKKESIGERPTKRMKLCMPANSSLPRHWTGATLLKRARQLFKNEDLQWRCEEQERAACAIMSGGMEIAVIMATGMGKSLLFQLAASLPDARTTIIVVPLVALKLDQIRRCCEIGIDCAVWSRERQPATALVFMSMEAAVSEDGLQYLQRLRHREQLARIVLDECHLIATASQYRPIMRQSQFLRQIPVQFVYLTATLPLYVRTSLYEQHCLTQINEIRGRVRRRNIQYTVLEGGRDSRNLLASIVKLFDEHWRAWAGQEEQRALIFTRSKGEAERLAAQLGCDSYHSDVGDEDARRAIIQAWQSGLSRRPVLVGTGGLGTGLDYRHVRLVIHVDAPYGLIDFVQESGRAGRDGKTAKSVILLPHDISRSTTDKTVLETDEHALHEYLYTDKCRRRCIDRYMDGESSLDENCTELDEKCDHCTDEKKQLKINSTNLLYLSSASHSSVSARSSLPSQGPTLLLNRASVDEIKLGEYIRRLTAMKSQCMICRIEQLDCQHLFGDCHNPSKFDFMTVKRTVKARGSEGQAWIARYHACFYCYQPQMLCCKIQKQGFCEYPDLVMQAVFAVFERDDGGWIAHEFGAQLSTAADALQWAGTKCELLGMKTIRGVELLDRALQQLEDGSDGRTVGAGID